MILPKPEDTLHKAQLLRLLTGILDDNFVSQHVYFKGGTCAAMLGFLDRFSLDLDFDLKDRLNKKLLAKRLEKIFVDLDLEIDKKSRKELFYVLKYKARKTERNSIKLSLTPKAAKSNEYKPCYLPEIDRFALCQTVETMFANKLVSLTDRYKKYRTIAGRDLYDIHYFFLNGYSYVSKIIKERNGKDVKTYLKELKTFIEKRVSDKILSEDLNYLLPYEKFRQARKILKKETLMFLQAEIEKN